MDGETAKLILSGALDTSASSSKTSPASSTSGSVPLQVRSLKAGGNDSLIQVTRIAVCMHTYIYIYIYIYM